jgi:hypothetical protein
MSAPMSIGAVWSLELEVCELRLLFRLQTIHQSFRASKRKPNRRSYIQFASYMHGLAMGLDNMFADGQSEPGSANIAAAAAVGAVKTFKYAGEVFFGNADAIITELYQYMLPSVL